MEKQPTPTKVYQNHHLDSSRWDTYEPRSDDVIITTAYKSGTTWTQDIFYELIHGDDAEPLPRKLANVWPDAVFLPVDKASLKQWLANLPKQRYIKSHLPLDGLPYFPEVKYVVVCRDPRDVFMSFYNHFSRYTDEFYDNLNHPDKLVGEPLPRCPEDIREAWKPWISEGWFPWESEGFPFWSNLHHTQTYWDYKHLPNIKFMHYNDMLDDLEGAVRELAGFANIEVDNDKVNRVVNATTFETARERAISEQDTSQPQTFKGGVGSFYFKGSNGRWRDVLTEEDLKLYDQAMNRVLSPDCAAFLENGRSALT